MFDFLGSNAGKDQMEESLQLQKDARDELKGLYVPTTAEQEILLQNPELAGLLEAEQLQDSRLNDVSTDPRLKQAQMSALEQLSGLSETGLGAEDVAAFNNLRRQSGAEAQAQNASVLQNAASQGTLTSGNTLMAQLMAGQQGANRTSEGAEALAAQASQARREALSMKANMASQLGAQDFSQKSSVKVADDAIDRFNKGNRQDVNATNLNNRQNISNQSNANVNRQTEYNKGLVQQQFQNNLAKSTGVAQQTGNLAAAYGAQGQAAAQGQADMKSGLLNAGAQMGAAYVGKK